ncbi:HAD family hydrolase [Tabrizicola sp.]|uniref:HAD family hydrolase n=1 Tax=Tabrizicola sp. TaxID=2005166 RepID=UPI003F380619
MNLAPFRPPPPTIRHVIWDWNGTLLDDTDLTVRASIEWLASKGRHGLTRDDIRRHASRDFAAFFGSLLNRPLGSDELADAIAFYRRLYEPLKRSQSLATDAHDALAQLAARGRSQSILSMAPQTEVQELTRLHGIDGLFIRIEGQSDEGGMTKLDSLRLHLAALGLDPADVAMIGDSLDDHAVSTEAGLWPVLVSTGLTDAARLRKTGAVVVPSLLEAIGCLP